MNWLLLASFVGLALTLNAWRPIYAPASVAVVSFFAGWLTAELPLHHLAWQALVAATIAYKGGLATWPGAVAFAANVASGVGLVLLHHRASRAAASVERALREGLGADYTDRLSPRVRDWLGATLAWNRLAFPFWGRNAEVETTRNITFCRVAGIDLTLDVHRRRHDPSQRKSELAKRAPTLVYVHGGGWMISQRRYQGLPLMKHLASLGWVCISIDYRLSPRATFPDHLIDVKRAIAWVREHAADYGADPDFIVLCGNSAGAHLASLAALTPNEPSYQPGFESVDTSVSACIALYGIFDFTDQHGHWPNRGMANLVERYVMKATLAASPDAYKSASPFHRIHAGAPPFLIVHGDSDSLAPTGESRRFSAALRGVTRAPVVYAEIPHAQHAFEIFPSARTAHFLSGATAFLGYVYSAHLERVALATGAEDPRALASEPPGKPIDGSDTDSSGVHEPAAAH